MCEDQKQFFTLIFHGDLLTYPFFDFAKDVKLS